MKLKQQIKKSKINDFIEILNEYLNNDDLSNWKINTIKKSKFNIYIESNYQIESILNSKREEIFFTIYKDFEGELIGESSFNIDFQTSIEEFKKEIKDAIFICSQSKSKKYILPNSKDKNVDDSKIDYSIFYNKNFEKDFNSNSLNIFFAQKVNILKNLIDENREEISLKVNCIEFLNSLSKTSILTSKNIEKSYLKNSTELELIITTINNETKKETEFVVFEKLNDSYNFDFEIFFLKIIKYAIDTSKEIKAKNFNGKIILNETATIDFFNPDLTMNSIIGHASGRLKYFKISKYEKNKEVISNSKFDKLTIYSNPLIENSNFSIPYDLDGISSKKICLIEKNIFKNNFTNKQFADYLKIDATGPFGIIEIEPGNKSIKNLFNDSDELIEIISFASFTPDLISGDFSAEIRLGYKIKNGIKIPFKGGLFTGNIFEILKEVELSKELISNKGYFGPKNIKFHKGEIIGL